MSPSAPGPAVDDNTQLVSPAGEAGTLDPTFAREGRLTLGAVPTPPVFAADGSFAMCVEGYVRHYDKDGKRDGAFGDTDDGANVRRCTGLIPRAAGGYLVYDAYGPTFTVVSADGSVDLPDDEGSSSSGDGSSTTTTTASTVFGATPDGSVLVAGRDTDGFQLRKFGADGELVSSWANDGVTRPTADFDRNFSPSNIFVKADGGAILIDYDDIFSMTPKGKLTNLTSDTSVDSDLFAFRNALEIGSLAALTQDAKGRTLIATSKYDYESSSSSYDDADLAVVRLTSKLDDVDTTFGRKGVATAGLSHTQGGTSVAVQLDGKVLVMGMVGATTTRPAQLTIARFTEDGDLDDTFGDEGIAHPITLEKGESFNAGKLTLGKRGVIYVTGSIYGSSSSSSSYSSGVLLRIRP